MSMTITIAVDFDGTCVQHDFPRLGADVPGAAEWLGRFAEAGARLILWTCRDAEYLTEAVHWFARRGIPLFAVNHNPTQEEWSRSPKAFAHVYIDDMALGCPLVDTAGRPCVDWQVVGPRVLARIHEAA